MGNNVFYSGSKECGGEKPISKVYSGKTHISHLGKSFIKECTNIISSIASSPTPASQ